MNKRLIYVRFLSIYRIVGAAILTFLISFLPTPPDVYATEFNDQGQGYSSAALLRPKQDSVLWKDERKAKLKMVAAYAKKELPNWMPGLPSFLRSPQNWLSNNLKSLGDSVGNTWESTGGEDIAAAIIEPMGEALSAPDEDIAHALWIAPEYSHKGFMPLHDAVIFGVKSRHRLWNEAVEFNVHPHVGQNWRNTENFWGTTIRMDFNTSGQGRDAPKRKIGSIVISYANGDQDVIHGRNRGLEMRSEFQFTTTLSLDAGVKNDESRKTESYVMMKWKLANF